MRAALALLLVVACGGAEAGLPDGGHPDAGGSATAIRAMLYYDLAATGGPYCCSNSRATCNPYLDLTTDALPGLRSRYVGCRWTVTQALYEIDCTGNCTGQTKNCGQGLVCSQYTCPAPVGGSAAACTFYYP